MTLRLTSESRLVDDLRRGSTPKPADFVALVRDCYPELWRRVLSAVPQTYEMIAIEPGDVVLVRDGDCVMQREPLLRRKHQRRDLDERDNEGEASGEGAVRHDEIWKDIDAPKNGIVAIEWDRPGWGSLEKSPSSGRIRLCVFEPLGSATREVPLDGMGEGALREFAEAFATRCIPVALNGFFGFRMFLLASNLLLFARADLHGSDRLQEILRNPTSRDSQYVIENYAAEHAEVFGFFKSMRDEAFASEDRRAERRLDEYPRSLALQILLALAVPQIHGTIGVQLRMQFALVQPSSVVGVSLARAGAVLQPAWDPMVQLRVLFAGGAIATSG